MPARLFTSTIGGIQLCSQNETIFAFHPLMRFHPRHAERMSRVSRIRPTVASGKFDLVLKICRNYEGCDLGSRDCYRL